jgi:hypothetical protein
VVDDFGIKYVGKEHAEHLKATIEKYYQISCDWTGSAYCCLMLDWYYKSGCVDLSMSGYIKAALHKFQHTSPTCPENAPHTWSPPVYVAKIQNTIHRGEQRHPHIYSEGHHTHSTVSRHVIILCAGRIPNFNFVSHVLASDQTQDTAATAEKVIKLLNYYATHLDAKLRYDVSDMILNIHNDASYLSKHEAKSRAGGYFYLGSNITEERRA